MTDVVQDDRLEEMWEQIQHMCDIAESRASRERMKKWAIDNEEDEERQRKWVKAQAEMRMKGQECKPEAKDALKGGIHPAQRIREAARPWCELWNRPHLADECPVQGIEALRWHREQLQDLLGFIPEGGYRCEDITITAEDLIGRTERARKRAPGGDAWRPSDLLRLPRAWWDMAAEVWNTRLEVGIVPGQWALCRTVLLEKPGG